ncbi:L-fucose isomerase-like protein [Planctomycetales bacterium]|nr:L-fucose isomerase-like protein [Planctomycetales bacterium]
MFSRLPKASAFLATRHSLLFMKIAVFFIGRKRPGFDPQWGASLEAAVRSQLETSPFEPVFFGPVADDTTLARNIAEARQSGVEAIIVSQPTMGDGNLWSAFVTEWDSPVIIFATPENPKNTKVSACGLVGAHNWASGLSQVGRPPIIVYGLPGQSETITELNQAVQVAATARKLQHARVGLIGDHAPGFLNMAVDAGLLQQLLGPRLKRIGLYEFSTLVRSFSDSEVAADRKRVESLGLPIKPGIVLSENDWNISSRYYLAVKRIVEEESFDAVALRCWPELPNEFGVWAYLAIARLASDGINICEEGDVDGAIGTLIARSLGADTAAYNSDWLEHDDDSITLWHAGATPFGICEPIGSPHGPTLSVHFNSGKPLVVDARLAADIPVTLFRLWRFRNEYRLAVVEGQIASPTREIEGCAGRVFVNGGGVKQFFLDACYDGMPHHLTVAKGHYAAQLEQLAAHHQPQPIELTTYLQ